MDSKFSLSFSNSPNPDMPGVRTNLDDEFAQEEQKPSDNMCVYARIRPMLQREEDAGYKECIAAIDDETVRALFPKSSLKYKSANHNENDIIEDFKYSKAFGPETGQFLFFEETIMKTMQSFIDGQNCLIFSYGITSSGKTYTLQGNKENPGIIILALRLFFSAIEHQLLDAVCVKPEKFADLIVLNEAEQLKEIAARDELMKFYNHEVGNKSAKASKASTSLAKSFAMKLCDCFSDNVKFGDVETTLPPEEMEASQSAQVMKMLSRETADKQSGNCNIWISFIEIYNEQIYDLLQPNVFPREKLLLAEDQSGDVYVKGAKEVYVSNVEEALKLLHVGRKSLRIASTKLNYQSSRSHCIYILKVVRLNEECTSFRINRLSFCDLAGSERASKSEASGMRLKEACYINKSLLVLGRCLEQLRLNQNSKEKKQMIPFRESKLTRFFSGHFMGKGNAVMIANASPCEYTFDETLNVLKFSAVAKELILNDKYMKEASSSLETITSQWAQSRTQLSSFSLDQSSNLENSLYEDIQARDEMIEKLLDLADSLRSNLEQEKREKANLEYTIRQEVYRDYSTYSDELLARQKDVYEGQLEDLKDHYNKRLDDLEKRKNEYIKELRDQILELEATSEESFQSVNDNLYSPSKKSKSTTPSKVEVSTKADQNTATTMQEFAKESKGEMQSDSGLLSKVLEENRILKLELCSLKNQLEVSSLELQKSSEEINRLQNEIIEYKNKTDLENVSDLKCDHIPEIERLSADLISLKEDLNLVTAERDSIKEELEQMSVLLQESETNKSAAEDKCLHLDSKLQESLNVLEQFEKEVALLKSGISVAETKIADLTEEEQKMKDTVFSLSEELAFSTELIEKLKSEKLEIEGTLATSVENLKTACENKSDFEKKLEEATNAIAKLKSNILALESESEAYKTESSKWSAKCKSLEEEKRADEKHSGLIKKLEEATQALEKQTAKIFALESECEAYKSESSNLFAKCKYLEKEKASVSQNLENLVSEKEATKKISNELINSLKSDLVNSEKEFAEIKVKLEEADVVMENKEIAFNQLKDEHASLQHKLVLLENKLSSIEDIHGKCDLELSSLKQKLNDAHKLLEEQEILCSSLKSDNAKLLEGNKTLKDEVGSKAEESLCSEAEISFGSENPSKLDTYKMRLSEKERECETLNNQYNVVLNKRHELEEEIATLAKKLVTAANDVEKLKKENSVANEALENLKRDFQNASDSLKQKETEFESLQNECAHYKEENSELKKEKKDLEEKSTDLLNKLGVVKAELSELEHKNVETMSNLQSLDTTLERVQKELEKSEEERKLIEENYAALVTKSNDEVVLKHEVERLNLLIKEASSKEAELQEQNSTLIAELASKYEQILKNNEAIEHFKEKLSSAFGQLDISALEEKTDEVQNLSSECASYNEENIQSEKENGKLEDGASDLLTIPDADLKQKLLEAESSLQAMESKLSKMQTVVEEKKLLEEKYSALMENNNAANKDLSDLREKCLETTNALQTLELKLSSLQNELQNALKEKRILEEENSALVERNGNIEGMKLKISEASSLIEELQNRNSALQASLEGETLKSDTINEELSSMSEKFNLVAEELNSVRKDNEAKNTSLKNYAELIKVLELSEFKATEKIKSREDALLKHSSAISDMERQIREKELAISELEKALDESQKRVKEINSENQKLLKQSIESSHEEKAKKKTAYKVNDECDNKENADKSESSKDKQLKRNPSITSEEGDKLEEPKKTRRALRARQADSITTVTAYDSDTDDKPKTVSRKRKSDEEFIPSKRTHKETSKARKIPSRRVLKDKKENLESAQNENMSPVQKVAAFVGSTLKSVGELKFKSSTNTVSSIPSPRMTRGRKKLFNFDSAATSSKNWKY